MDRFHLLLSDIEIFAAWAQGEGYVREITRGDYEALRLRKGKGHRVKPLIFFWRRNKLYVTAQDPARPLVQRFLKDKIHNPEKLEFLKEQQR